MSSQDVKWLALSGVVSLHPLYSYRVSSIKPRFHESITYNQTELRFTSVKWNKAGKECVKCIFSNMSRINTCPKWEKGCSLCKRRYVLITDELCHHSWCQSNTETAAPIGLPAIWSVFLLKSALLWDNTSTLIGVWCNLAILISGLAADWRMRLKLLAKFQEVKRIR